MSSPATLRFNPNPGFGRIPFLDALRAFGGVSVVTAQVLFFLLHRPLRTSKISWQKELQIFILRKMLGCLPLSVVRRPAGTAHVFNSNRYKQRLSSFPEILDRPDFSGMWLCKPGFDRSAAPRDADVVIVYVHGGGYVTGQPGQGTSLLLRVAEGVEGLGQKVAILALDYSLAPEHRFPHQLRQMVACWAYLVAEMEVPVSKLALLGDSAGGSLCLSFLTHMSCPLTDVPEVTVRTQPGRGVFLVSPWVSLLDESGYKEKANLDVLDVATLRTWARSVVNGVDEREVQRYLEFAYARDDFNSILPSYTWVSAGADEIFSRNITRFVDAARSGGLRVDYDVLDSAAHDWQFMEALSDEAKFLEQEFGTLQEGLMSGADALAKAIASASKPVDSTRAG